MKIEIKKEARHRDTLARVFNSIALALWYYGFTPLGLKYTKSRIAGETSKVSSKYSFPQGRASISILDILSSLTEWKLRASFYFVNLYPILLNLKYSITNQGKK